MFLLFGAKSSYTLTIKESWIHFGQIETNRAQIPNSKKASDRQAYPVYDKREREEEEEEADVKGGRAFNSIDGGGGPSL